MSTSPDEITEIGRPYSPTDETSPLLAYLGRAVNLPPHGRVEIADVHVDGTVTLTRDGFVVAIVPTDTVTAAL